MSNDTPPSSRVASRWWVDQGKGRERTPDRPAPARISLFRVGEGYEQERARERLTDLNLKLLHEAPPPPNGWSRLCLVDTPSPPAALARVEKALPLPPDCRALLVDSGGSALRVIVTGSPLGERVVELNLGGAPSFDAWIGTEWVREELFDSVQKALARAPALIDEYLGPTAGGRALF